MAIHDRDKLQSLGEPISQPLTSSAVRANLRTLSGQSPLVLYRLQLRLYARFLLLLAADGQRQNAHILRAVSSKKGCDIYESHPGEKSH